MIVGIQRGGLFAKARVSVYRHWAITCDGSNTIRASGSGEDHQRGRNRHAQRLQRIVRCGARPVRARPAEWPPVSIHEPQPHANEGAGVGWQRTLGLCQETRERTIRVAFGAASRQHHNAARGTGDADKRAGFQSDKGASKLASAQPRRVKHFCLEM
jgi:hypothetical protein